MTIILTNIAITIVAGMLATTAYYTSKFHKYTLQRIELIKNQTDKLQCMKQNVFNMLETLVKITQDTTTNADSLEAIKERLGLLDYILEDVGKAKTTANVINEEQRKFYENMMETMASISNITTKRLDQNCEDVKELRSSLYDINQAIKSITTDATNTIEAMEAAKRHRYLQAMKLRNMGISVSEIARDMALTSNEVAKMIEEGNKIYTIINSDK